MFAKLSRGKTAGRNVGEIKAQIVDKISSAIMMVDRDFIVTYVNEPTRQLLKSNEAAFRAIWPSFNADNIMGTCIDTFHKNPAHQRQLLADAKRLPINTEITIGHLKVALLVSGAFDAKNNLVGNILEWRDVTTERMNTGMLDAINKSQAVIEFTVDGKIQHANENFLHAMGYTLEEILIRLGLRQGHFSSQYLEESFGVLDVADAMHVGVLALRRALFRGQRCQEGHKLLNEAFEESHREHQLDR